MPTTVAAPPLAAIDIPRKVWTRQDAEFLVEAGFPNVSKLELIDGELIDKMGKKHPHVMWQHLVMKWLQEVLGWEYVLMGAPVDVAAQDNEKNEPEPDVIVTARRIQEYTANPPAGDLRLVVEVSDSTIDFDLAKKARLYARARIADYWVLDLKANRVVVHREPEGDRYTSVIAYAADEEIRPLAAPESIFKMSSLAG